MPSLTKVFASVQWAWGGDEHSAPITAPSGAGVVVKSWCPCPPPPRSKKAVRSCGKSVWKLTPSPPPHPSQSPDGEQCSDVREPRVGTEAYGSMPGGEDCGV